MKKNLAHQLETFREESLEKGSQGVVKQIKKIRSNPATKSIPVIMLTGISSRDLVNNCMRAGASGFMIKPGDRDSILGKIKQTLDKE